MSTVTTTKPIEPSQLDAELATAAGLESPPGLTTEAIEGQTTVRCEHPAVTQQLLDAAVAAHVPTPVEANRTTLANRASAALDANRTYLALTSPTNAQNLAQIRLLTRECTALIRLLLNRLDGTD